MKSTGGQGLMVFLKVIGGVKPRVYQLALQTGDSPVQTKMLIGGVQDFIGHVCLLLLHLWVSCGLPTPCARTYPLTSPPTTHTPDMSSVVTAPNLRISVATSFGSSGSCYLRASSDG